MGFILAASGSAIGLGNIVFFGANAYQFGGGAFYIPYLIALFVVGIPVMMMELGIGQQQQRAFPQALKQMVGTKGEFVGWWALFNAGIISMYYITLLGWVLGMLVGAFGPLWESSTPTPGYAPESLPNPIGYFFATLASPKVLIFVAIVWVLNVVICWKGTKSIEATVKFFVPAMWVMMIVLIVRGVTLPNGWDGVMYLFKPDFAAMGEIKVWHGAFAQIFFSLSLGFGLLPAYASYLPKRADTDNYAGQISLLNCAFEYVAGFAIFSMLFAFAIVPKASTLSMSFFVFPHGISQLPAGVKMFGILFFTLLLLAGLSSSISLLEGFTSAVLDKFNAKRKHMLLAVSAVGFLGSIAFAWPRIIDPGLNQGGTLGLTLLDLFDHKAFGYGLLMVGLVECLLIGWSYGAVRFQRERRGGRELSSFDKLITVLVAGVIPVTLAFLIGYGLWEEWQVGGYGGPQTSPGEIGNDKWTWLKMTVPLIWVLFTAGGAAIMTMLKGREESA